MLYALLPGVGPQEMIIVAIVGVLLFGKRLPEVGRSIGRGIVEFKKGLRGIEDELDFTSSPGPAKSYPKPVPTPSFKDRAYDFDLPKFEPPTSAPVPIEPASAPADSIETPRD